jgi:predicted nucleic acid-binding protein
MLLDTNIVIYSVQPQHSVIRQFMVEHACAVSGITYVEALGFHRIVPDDLRLLTETFDELEFLEIDRTILDRAVMLRQQRKMSLGDAIIAATALIHDKTLVTHNTADFQWIANLKLLDPMAQP